MEIIKSGAKYSAIVGIGEELKQLSKDSGKKYLMLNRGINRVTKINLTETVKNIDFDTEKMQFYAPTTGMFPLKKAINTEFFQSTVKEDEISITAGGMNALNLIFQVLNTRKVYVQSLYWGAYLNLFKIQNTPYDFYHSIQSIYENPEEYANATVIICDPNNPAGDKSDDALLLKLVSKLEKQNTTVIWDGPYRRLFMDSSDNLYSKLAQFPNVIICESFSKSIGLSGQRLGFIYSTNEEFNTELAIRLLYSGNGINTFAQLLVEQLLVSEEGKKAVSDFKRITTQVIKKNIAFLIENKLLADEFYQNSVPKGIFVILKKPYQELLKYRIGSVPLNYFSQRKNIDPMAYSRICVSVPHADFIRFFKSVK